MTAHRRDRPLRVGHKGAGKLAARNSLAALRLAPELGLDVVEFDVVRRPADGVLVLAYSPVQARLTVRPTLAEALALLAGLPGLRLAADLKERGTEAGVAGAVRAHGLAARTLITARAPAALRAVRAADAEVALGWSVGRPWHARMVGEANVRRAIARALATRLCDAVMLHHPLVSADTVAAAGGAELFAWTVNRPDDIRRLSALGVSGIVTDDPRLLA